MVTLGMLIALLTIGYLMRKSYQKMAYYGCLFALPLIFFGIIFILLFIGFLSHLSG